ncbi:lysylphosphatidylglycerol synthase domain-containing protein [Streptomyces sp. SS1-1]|uniref:lysylphosphatidylglycerol synthase domain-containing protein n=1 Tax=Streptomyces sp. SS1-1 TaxID=2651869 RepID=UPI00298F4EE6|nr:lysylphosphatidylglycerol synthase domain-containing protein [Streptomyces sp. SS1-1]
MTPDPALTPARRARAYAHTALTLAVLLAVVWLARRHWPVLHTGAVRLAAADRAWLLAAAAATLTTWPCAALAQQGAVLRLLPPTALLGAQFAASAAGHVLPVGLGSGAVNLRYLVRAGLPLARAAIAMAVKGTAGVAVRAALIAGLVLACPGVLRLPGTAGECRPPCARRPCASCCSATPYGPGAAPPSPRCAATASPSTPGRPARRPVGRLPRLCPRALRRAHRRRPRGRADLGPARLALLYLAASGAAALLPTPGGLGSLDAVLAYALTTAGAPAATAASTVLGYRLLTVWLPLLPGLLVLALLIRRRTL